MPASAPASVFEIPFRTLRRGSLALPFLTFALAGACQNAEPGLYQTPKPGPGEVCQRTCTKDPGSRAVDCAEQELGYEFLPLNEFNGSNATALYSYTDRTYAISSFQQQTWEPPTLAYPRCGQTDSVLHIQGGPYLAWGGGVGTSLKNMPPTDCNGDPAGTRGLNPVYDPLCSKNVGSLGGYVRNLSEWEGVSLWARRGPDSQAGLRVTVGDQYTDDDISYLMFRKDAATPRFCERVRECGCLNHQECQPFPFPSDAAQMEAITGSYPKTGMGLFCGDPTGELCPGQVSGACGSESASSASRPTYSMCGQLKCDWEYPAFPGPAETDPQFNNKPCTVHAFRNGVSGSFCFDPAKDPPPAEPDEQCGDHWNLPINLTTDWRLYKVPFSAMLQQGFAKKQPRLDTSVLALVRLTWDGGYTDFYIDSLSFYRRKKQ